MKKEGIHIHSSGKLFLLIFSLLFILNSCKKVPDELVDDHYTLTIPPGFPSPFIPDDNQLTKSRIALGKKLFFDKRLSVDNTISCGSCHFPENAFSDITAKSLGVQGRIGMRNAPPLYNLAWANSFMRDGGVPTLELQVLAPIADHVEMDFNILSVVDRLKNDPYYKKQAQRAYARDFDAFVITRAIAAFERILISGNSKYDRYVRGTENLNASELNGMNLFFSSNLNCSSCHSGFNFTNNNFENNGLYLNYADTGRARITLQSFDSGKFKVSSLRNSALTAPYMFDGSKNTLEEVIDHYASGGQAHPNKNPLVSGFSITTQEKIDLINFLNTLTDDEFLNNPEFRPN